MKRLQQWWSRVFDALRLIDHYILNIVRGRSIHLVLTGTDRDALDTLVHTVAGVHRLRVPQQPTRASDTQNNPRKFVATWHLADLTDFESVRQSVGRYRTICVVVATADPRDSICSEDPRLPHQSPDSADYSIEGAALSLTAPGVLPRFRALDVLRKQADIRFLELTKEQLQNPAQVLSSVGSVVGRRGKKFPGTPSTRAGALTPPTSPWFTDGDRIRRVAAQLLVHPELEARATAEGYPPADKLVDAKQLERPVTRGTIIAFHTPDEVYRTEAARLKSTLDKLNLAYRLVEVAPHENWVRTTLSKPSWIIELREQLTGPLLYIDVDALVHEDPWPVLSRIEADVAAHVTPRGEFTSGTVLINDTQGARRLLARWRELAEARRDQDRGDLEATGENGDQGLLKEAVVESEKAGGTAFAFHRLPPNLTYIFDRVETTYLEGPVLIEHLQASRESSGHEKRLARRRERLAQLDSGS